MGALDKFLDIMKLNGDDDFDEDEYYEDYEEEQYYNDKPSSRRSSYMKKDNDYNDLDDYDDYQDYGYEKESRGSSKRKENSGRSVTRSDRNDRDDYNDRMSRNDRMNRNDRMDRDNRNDRTNRDVRNDRMDRDARNDRDIRGDRDVRNERDVRGDRMDRDIRNDRMDRDDRNDDFNRNLASSNNQNRFEDKVIRNAGQARTTAEKTQTSSRQSTERKNTIDGAGGVCVVRPTSIEDSRDIVETLLNNRTVVLNLEGLDIEIAQRIIDFTSGACFAIDGNLQKVSQYIFLLTPSNVNISGDLNNIFGERFAGMKNAENAYYE